MARQPQPVVVEQLPERVVARVQPGLDATCLLRRVARPGRARALGHVRMLRRREEEVDPIRGPVEERAAVALSGKALVLVGVLAARVALPLALRVPLEYHVAGLRQRLS